MALYEYVCPKCGRQDEKITRNGTKFGPPETKCPDCGAKMRCLFANNPLFLGDLQAKRKFKPSDYGRSGL